jgi:outer membrane protein assembly factor BamA
MVSESIDRATTEQPAKFSWGGTPGYIVMPIPIAEPTLGNGLALATMFTYKLQADDEVSPPSQTILGAAYTDTDSNIVGLQQKFFWNEDRYRAAVTLGRTTLNLKYFGSDGSILNDNPIDYRLEGYFFAPKFQVRMGKSRWFLGSRIIISDVDASFDLTPPGNGEDLRLGASLQLNAIGVLAAFDSRDNQFSATKGVFLEWENDYYDERIGSVRDFRLTKLAARHYYPINKTVTLASRINLQGSSEDTPFFMLPRIPLRGFNAGRYRDQYSMAIEAELRWYPSKIGFVVFTGVGTVASDDSQLLDGSSIISKGVGIRYMPSSDTRLVMGIDYATSSDESAWYFRISEAF